MPRGRGVGVDLGAAVAVGVPLLSALPLLSVLASVILLRRRLTPALSSRYRQDTQPRESLRLPQPQTCLPIIDVKRERGRHSKIRAET